MRAAKSKIARKEKSDLLYRAILKLETEEECYSFFQDLCTISELRSMEQRFEVAMLLNEGMIYNDILEKTVPPAPPSAASTGVCWAAAAAMRAFWRR